MHDKLNEIYSQMLKESTHDMTVGTVKSGELEGSENAKPSEQVKTPDNQVDSPEEGLSQGEVKKGGASTNMSTVKGKKEKINDSLSFTSKFEDLYKSVIGEDMDEMDEISDAPEIESDSFDDELGDFGDDEDVSEETDIAVELRTMAERLQELADKFSETSMSDEELDMDENDLEMDIEDEDINKLGESVKSEPEPKPLKATDKGPHMSKTVKGKLSSVSSKKAKVGMKGSYDGSPSPLSDKVGHTNKTGMTVKGSGSAVSGKNSDLFDK